MCFRAGGRVSGCGRAWSALAVRGSRPSAWWCVGREGVNAVFQRAGDVHDEHVGRPGMTTFGSRIGRLCPPSVRCTGFGSPSAAVNAATRCGGVCAPKRACQTFWCMPRVTVTNQASGSAGVPSRSTCAVLSGEARPLSPYGDQPA